MEFIRAEFKEFSEDESKIILTIPEQAEEIEVPISIVDPVKKAYLEEGMRLALRSLDEKPSLLLKIAIIRYQNK